MLKEVVASNAAKLIAACVCPVAGAGVVALKVPEVRSAVHKATAPRTAKAKPSARAKRPPVKAEQPAEKSETALAAAPPMCAQPLLLNDSPFKPGDAMPVSMPAPRLETVVPERSFVPSNCGSVTVVRNGIVSASIAAVPEPATWAQMIAGFALLGAFARTDRRRRVLA